MFHGVKLKTALAVIALVFLIFTSSFCMAEIYRWVDDNGEVHYSDKKPDIETVTEVSGELEPINRDSSSGETKKLQEVFKDETPEDRQYRLQQENRQNQQAASKEQACAKARNELRKLKGRFYMVGKDGKEITVTEDEQQRMVENLEKQIKKHC